MNNEKNESSNTLRHSATAVAEQPKRGRVVLFALDGVVNDFNWRTVDAYGRQYGLPWGEFARAVYRSPARAAYLRGEITRDAWVADARGRLRRYWGGCTADRLAGFLRHEFDLNPAMLRLATALRRAGIQTLLVANAGHDELAALTQAPACTDAFDRVLSSAALGAAAPDAGFYTGIRDALAVAGDEAIYVDQDPGHLEAARAAGLRVTAFDGNLGHLSAGIVARLSPALLGEGAA